MTLPTKHKNKKINPKGWGDEKVIHNNERYCVKILSLNKGGRCSLHYHKRKEESFLVLSGKVEVDFVVDGEETIMILEEGESVDIPPYVAHRFKALETSELLEASSQDLEEDDLIRIEAGDTQDLNRQLPIGNREFIKWEEKCKSIIGN